jgi:hypothetical protein
MTDLCSGTCRSIWGHSRPARPTLSVQLGSGDEFNALVSTASLTSLVSLGRGPVARMGGELIVRTPGSTGNARERHGLFRCGAFVRPALAAHRSRNVLSPRTLSQPFRYFRPGPGHSFFPARIPRCRIARPSTLSVSPHARAARSPSVSLLIADRVAGAWLSGGLAFSAHQGPPLAAALRGSPAPARPGAFVWPRPLSPPIFQGPTYFPRRA